MCYKLDNTIKIIDNTRKFLQIWHLLLHFVIEQLFSFIVLGNKDGDMSYFKFLFLLYVTLTLFSGKNINCSTKNTIYLIACKCCGKQYIDSATGFKERFQNHMSDINTGKIRYEVASHLLNVCKSAKCKIKYLQVRLIENVLVREGEDADKVLWEREKYWQAQLFTLTHGLNNMNEWYALNRRGYRK